jgi:hypothetical protein
MAPTKDDARTGAYYLARTLYLATRKPESPGAPTFLAFSEGADGQAVWDRWFALLP